MMTRINQSHMYMVPHALSLPLMCSKHVDSRRRRVNWRRRLDLRRQVGRRVDWLSTRSLDPVAAALGGSSHHAGGLRRHRPLLCCATKFWDSRHVSVITIEDGDRDNMDATTNLDEFEMDGF